jgi:hypothetical protein
MDLQYAPRVLARPAAADMERAIAQIAHQTHIGIFRRFEIMQEWDRTGQFRPEAMIDPDGLHMTDQSYGCLAQQLADALTRNWRSRTKLVKSPERNPEAVAGIENRSGTQPGFSAKDR